MRKNSGSIRSILTRSSHSSLVSSLGSEVASTTSTRAVIPARQKEEGMFDAEGKLKYQTIHEIQVNACRVYNDRRLFGQIKGGGKGVDWMTYGEFGDNVQKTRGVLKDLGVEEATKVGIISINRWEWAAVAAAAFSLNATIVPMYENQLPKDWELILNDSECAVLFCSTKEIYDRFQQEVFPKTPSIQACLCFDGKLEYSFGTALKTASDSVAIVPPAKDDLACIIYTSGTMGQPKGVELTHWNLVFDSSTSARSVMGDAVFQYEQLRSLSYLPWAHSFGQSAELWNSFAYGGCMGMCRGVAHILEDLALVKPIVLVSVPALFNRVYSSIHSKMESASSFRRNLMKWAFDTARSKRTAQEGLRSPFGIMEHVEYMVYDSLVLSKIRARVGGKLDFALVGGAACDDKVVDFMADIGIKLVVGYGLTEASPVIASNMFKERKTGTVGKCIDGVRVHIMKDGKEVAPGEEGEICCVGPNIMRGYHKNAAATEEVISVAPDGESRMLHTGDLGKMEDGWLSVTGRIKEQYKLANGKYVAPTMVEQSIEMSRFINQVVVAGVNRPHNVCLIAPDWMAVRTELKLPAEKPSDQELGTNERVKKLIDAEIKEHSSSVRVKKYEIPKAWAIVEPFTVENGLLTTKMNVRRLKAIEHYKEVLEKLYA